MYTTRFLGTIAAIGLIYFAPSLTILAVTPAPDGGYPGENTAEGEGALLNLTTGSRDTAIGFQALLQNTSGVDNTAIGAGALFSNTTGYDNTATGASALQSNTNGFFNTATGNFALVSNQSGNNNTAQGVSALFNSIGSNNIALGFEAGSDLVVGDNNIDIGNRGLSTESNMIRIGTKGTHTATYIAGIAETSVSGSQVVVNTNGKLGVPTSSVRFKDAIMPMGNASHALLQLKPVTFRYKEDIDPSGTLQFGLVAEDVEKVNRDLVARDAAGKPYTVRYEAVNAMLLNEFLKEHHTVQELKSNAAKQEATIAQQQKQIEALTAGLQKVSAQLELSKPTPQTVLNDQ